MSATRPPVFDERFTAPADANRRGAHRSRPNPVTAMLPLLAGAALVALVVGGAWTFLANDGDENPSSTVAAAPTSTPAASGSSRPSSSKSATPSSSKKPSSSASGAAGTVDEDAELVVLNSIRRQGLAAQAADQLKDEGWTIARTGNANQRNLETTHVYYADDDEEATAKAVVEDLGFGEAVQSKGNAAAGITVVLGHDAEQ